mmetsp:Transcript_1698/g.1802  ORF Transcript_1698/g.1802 Transcript_1698/m.1802 type:complete len:506 (+) Transcript_1698:93-1610(+)|eukprot:CAMPEP_0115024412 /NCGR_PEP_ID=MMETSP0216-20121206/33210_1 /TAXON_ID=223996 /ORGANISM="Protocruzia adherens, Strain Boccale" /LENGTH=505 /DNA_ID=CAMNT_0002398441 /DNA_START=73 /DNA_END=1590 /DNA_ORIENTATION=+
MFQAHPETLGTAAAVSAVNHPNSMVDPLKLFAQNVPKIFNEYDLEEALSVRPIRIQIKRDPIQHRSQGRALLMYETAEGAQLALKQDNYRMLGNKVLNLTKFKLGGRINPQREESTNICVKGLASTVDERQLHDVCQEYGHIDSLIICRNDQTKSLGYGYIRFEFDFEAENCISNLNGFELSGSCLIFERYVCKANRPKKPKNDLFVGNIPKIWTNEDLQSYFSRFGTITSGVVQRSKDNSEQNTGCGFVCFEHVDDAQLALQEMDGFEVDSIKLSVSEHKSKEELAVVKKKEFEQRREKLRQDADRKTIHLKALPVSITEAQLTEVFQQHGQVESIFLPTIVKKGRKQRSATFGRIIFANEADAKRILDNFTSMDIAGYQVGVRKFIRDAKSSRKFFKSYRHHHQHHHQNQFAQNDVIDPMAVNMHSQLLTPHGQIIPVVITTGVNAHPMAGGARRGDVRRDVGRGAMMASRRVGNQSQEPEEEDNIDPSWCVVDEGDYQGNSP